MHAEVQQMVSAEAETTSHPEHSCSHTAQSRMMTRLLMCCSIAAGNLSQQADLLAI